jgi:ammonium transporter, Amt family
MLGAASGAVAGLVAITPAAGNVGIPGAFAIGIGVGAVCLWGVTGLKKMIKADDSLDVFGVHALGGVFGALMTGIFNAPSLGGPGSVQDWVKGTVGYPGIAAQLWIQVKAVAIVTVWTAVVATVAFLAVKAVMGLRVSEEQEREGLDITSHGERAYDM